jgi:quinol monooxygenase YgiN
LGKRHFGRFGDRPRARTLALAEYRTRIFADLIGYRALPVGRAVKVGREPGTLVYACHQVADKLNQRTFYELYRDRAAFDAHEEQPHVKRFLAARQPLLDSFEVDFMTLDDGKTPVSEQAADRA